MATVLPIVTPADRARPLAAGSAATRRRLCAAPERRNAQPAPRVWAVGGGKGGVGKSVVASSLALSFARLGRRVVMVDADLGAANLHSFFGTLRDGPTLNDFLQKRVEHLAEVVAPTGLPRLGLISGARAALGDANLAHAQKQKLIRHLRHLPGDDVILDLSAGSAFNALDLFLAADRGLLVVVPEPTSVENAYHFLHAAFFRALRGAAQDSAVRESFDTVLERHGRELLRAPRRLLEEVGALDAKAGVALKRAITRFQPAVLVNKTRVENTLAWEMRTNTRRFLGVDLRVLGNLPWDGEVSRAIERQRAVLDLAPHADFSRALLRIVESQLYPRPSDTAGDERTAGLSPGQLFVFHRERQGKSRAEIAWTLRIREGMIRAIETEDFSAIPPGPYLHAWLIDYAKCLDIERGEHLVNRYLGRFRAAGGTAN